MHVVTLLNRIEKFKSFVYKKACLEEVEGKEAVVIEVRPRKNSPPVCRVCMKRCGTHATDRDTANLSTRQMSTLIGNVTWFN